MIVSSLLALVPFSQAPAPELHALELRATDGTVVRAERGRLEVPERRANPETRRIELAFLRLCSPAERPLAPVVFLAGGPGGAATPGADEPEAVQGWLPLLAHHDVILLDQRGTGASCPNLEWRSDQPVPVDLLLDEGVALDFARTVAVSALAHFREQGVDLAGYTTVESADDLESLRVALGYQKLSLLGFSYGTHLALATMKRHGARLERVVLIGTEGLDQTYKLPSTYDRQLARLAALVARDPEVGGEVPDLTALLGKVLAQLEEEPLEVVLRDPATGADELYPVGPWGLRFLLRLDLGDGNDFPVFPRLLRSIEARDPRLLAWFVQKRLRGFAGTSAMAVVMDYASGASPERLERIAREQRASLFANTMNFPFPAVGEGLDLPDLGAEYRAPFASDVVALFLSGTLDCQTPPEQAEEQRARMPRATHLVVANAGHEDILPMPEAQAAVAAFLRGEDVSGRTLALPAPRFVPLTGARPSPSHPCLEGVR